MATSFQFDDSSLRRGFQRYGSEGTKALLAGCAAGGDMMLAAATDIVPFDKGFNGGLAGSASKVEPRISGDEIEVEIGFNKSYAARLHEDMSLVISQKRTSGGQRRSQKYLEIPLKRDAEKFGRVVASILSKVQ